MEPRTRRPGAEPAFEPEPLQLPVAYPGADREQEQNDGDSPSDADGAHVIVIDLA